MTTAQKAIGKPTDDLRVFGVPEQYHPPKKVFFDQHFRGPRRDRRRFEPGGKMGITRAPSSTRMPRSAVLRHMERNPEAVQFARFGKVWNLGNRYLPGSGRRWSASTERILAPIYGAERNPGARARADVKRARRAERNLRLLGR
jgi:hypothetical protein